MALKIEPLKIEDLDSYVRIFWDAFAPIETDTILPMIYPNGMTPQILLRMRNRVIDDVGEEKNLIFAVRDPSSGEIMAVARWGIETQPPKTPEELDAAYAKMVKQREGGTEVEGENSAIGDGFFKAAYYSEHAVTEGKPYMTLKLLAADPRFGRRGAGTLLLRQGLERADEMDLPVYLDAARYGKSLYEKFGFEIKMDLPFDARKYGGRSEGKHWCMLRPAKSDRLQVESS